MKKTSIIFAIFFVLGLIIVPSIIAFVWTMLFVIKVIFYALIFGAVGMGLYRLTCAIRK